MTVTPIRRTSPKPADRQFQASMARNLARIIAGYDTSGTTPEVAADVRAIPDLLHDIADRLRLAGGAVRRRRYTLQCAAAITLGLALLTVLYLIAR